MSKAGLTTIEMYRTVPVPPITLFMTLIFMVLFGFLIWWTTPRLKSLAPRWVVLLYIGLTMLCTWPLALHLSTHIYGHFDHASADVFHILERFQNPMRTLPHVSLGPLMFFVARLGITTFPPVHPHLYYDVWPLIHIGSVVVMYLFMRTVGKSQAVSVVGAVIFLYVPLLALGLGAYFWGKRLDERRQR